MQTRLLINGELVTGDGEPIDVLDPASGEAVVGHQFTVDQKSRLHCLLFLRS